MALGLAPDNNSRRVPQRPNSLDVKLLSVWQRQCSRRLTSFFFFLFFYYRSRYGVSVRNVSVMGPLNPPLVSCVFTVCLSIFQRSADLALFLVKICSLDTIEVGCTRTVSLTSITQKVEGQAQKVWSVQLKRQIHPTML